jgi:chorismate dehydratase
MSFAVAMIPYANTAPYRELGPPSGCCFVAEHPRRSVHSLKHREVWASCVPVGGLPELAAEVEFVDDLGIAAEGEAQSVLLFSRVPFPDLCCDHRLAVTDQTVSSVRLLFLLLGYRQGFDRLPRVTADRERANAVLLIGDEALLGLCRRELGDPGGYPYVTDLATAWWEQWHVPFVFARWVVRRDAPVTVRTAMASWAAEFHSREAELVARAARAEATRLGLPESRVAQYFQIVHRIVDADDCRGQELFLSEWNRHRREPLFAAPAAGSP